MRPVAHYLTTTNGQLRLFVAGTGRSVVVLPGLIRGAAMVAARLVREAPDFSFHVLELPGIGGSAGVAVADARAAIAEAIAAIGLTHAPLLAFDLAASLCAGLANPTVTLGPCLAVPPPDLTPRRDGLHLNALFAYLRDCHVLDPDDPTRAARRGDALPDAGELDSTVVAAAVAPNSYHALWQSCAGTPTPRSDATNIQAALAALRALPVTASAVIPPPTPYPPLWCDYIDLPRGRQHLRRCGPSGRLLIALASAPGSAAPLAPLLAGLAAERRVVAPDYLGNGDSDKPNHPVDIARLARDTLDLADALGEPQFDLWGTHTGALIALEAALIAPDRVGRLVLEAPPLLPPDFTADILANYLPKLRPHPWGLHLQQAWCMRRDMFLFWPWYRAERAAIRPLRLPDADFLHDWTVGLLKSGATYDHSYRAAFEYDTRAALARLTTKALVCAGPSDMLADGLSLAATLAPEFVTATATPATVWYPHQDARAIAETVAIYEQFLAR